MIFRYLRYVVLPALYWALFAGSGFIGIGGMDLPAVTSGRVLRGFWYLGGVVAFISFVIALVILTRNAMQTNLLRQGT
jgi:hypothetical protein